MSFPSKGGFRICPVKGCMGRAATRMAMRVHFLHWHVLDTVVILEEGNTPPPTVPPMRCAGPLACIERKAPCQCTVCQGGGVEEKAFRGGGILGELREGLSGLWRTFEKCDGVQVYSKGDDGG